MEYALKDFRERMDEVPDEAGCYIFKGRGKPLYVGKAKSLRKRLSQYFSGKRLGDPKAVAMLKRATDVELMLTANETEALLLEMNSLINTGPSITSASTAFLI
jgi:excinuclease ABC subunit C